MSSLYQYFS